MAGLVAGEYELTIYAKVLPAGKPSNEGGAVEDRQPDGSVYRIAKQRVTVGDGEEAEVTLVIKANAKSE